MTRILDGQGVPLEPGSEEDQEYMKALGEEFASLPLVQYLRTVWEDRDGQQVRVFREWVAYSGLKETERRLNRLTTGPLAGTRGVAAQMAFWDHLDVEEICTWKIILNSFRCFPTS